jgi:hypothetical protein
MTVALIKIFQSSSSSKLPFFASTITFCTSLPNFGHISFAFGRHTFFAIFEESESTIISFTFNSSFIISR